MSNQNIIIRLRQSAAFAYWGVVIASVALGALYLLSPTFMPYHAAAIGREWGSLTDGEQVLFRALLRVAAGGWLAAGCLLGASPYVSVQRGAEMGILGIAGRFPRLLSTEPLRDAPGYPRNPGHCAVVRQRHWHSGYPNRRDPHFATPPKGTARWIGGGIIMETCVTPFSSKAIQTIMESGTAALSLRELARRLGVSPAAYAFHFPDKATLLVATRDRWLSAVEPRV